VWAAPEPADTEGTVAVLVLGVDAGVVAWVVVVVLGDALSEQAAAVVATVVATPRATRARVAQRARRLPVCRFIVMVPFGLVWCERLKTGSRT